MCNFDEYSKSQCCGCGACELVCPRKCISMELDEEGFFYPNLDASKCIQCGLCRKHCPIIIDTRNKEVLSAYGLTHKDKRVTDDSASGGAFTAIAEYILNRNGIVFGCSFNDKIEAVTISIEKSEELHKLRGSKYVQCNTNKQYQYIKETLNNGRQVLYCSTPCQIAGLKSYLGRSYDNLILLDLFCHGTPSPGLFRKYINWLGEKYHGKITEYSFRDKQYGWGTKGHFKTEQEYQLIESDPYYYSFLRGRIYRPVCYQCKYATSMRPGDISIGDYWGVEEFHPSIPTENGVSAILINTEKGKEIFDNIKEKVYCFSTSLENISSRNEQLIRPSSQYKYRDRIYSHLSKWTFEKLANRYLYSEPMLITRIRRLIPKPIKKIIRKYFM